MKNCDISIVDFINRTDNHPLRMPSVEFLANVKKERIILSLLRVEDLKKRSALSPNNRVLKLSLWLAETKLKKQQDRYLGFVKHYGLE